MDTLLVRMKAYAPRRGYVLKRYTYGGIKFLVERGWYRVTKAVAEYVRTVRAEPRNPDSPLAFDVCTDDEAHAIDVAEAKEAAGRQNATDELKLSVARGERRTLTTADLAGGTAPSRAEGPTAPAGVPSAAPPAAPAPPPVSAPAGAEGAESAAKGRKDKG